MRGIGLIVFTALFFIQFQSIAEPSGQPQQLPPEVVAQLAKQIVNLAPNQTRSGRAGIGVQRSDGLHQIFYKPQSGQPFIFVNNQPRDLSPIMVGLLAQRYDENRDKIKDPAAIPAMNLIMNYSNGSAGTKFSPITPPTDAEGKPLTAEQIADLKRRAQVEQAGDHGPEGEGGKKREEGEQTAFEKWRDDFKNKAKGIDDEKLKSFIKTNATFNDDDIAALYQECVSKEEPTKKVPATVFLANNGDGTSGVTMTKGHIKTDKEFKLPSLAIAMSQVHSVTLSQTKGSPEDGHCGGIKDFESLDDVASKEFCVKKLEVDGKVEYLVRMVVKHAPSEAWKIGKNDEVFYCRRTKETPKDPSKKANSPELFQPKNGQVDEKAGEKSDKKDEKPKGDKPKEESKTHKVPTGTLGLNGASDHIKKMVGQCASCHGEKKPAAGITINPNGDGSVTKDGKPIDREKLGKALFDPEFPMGENILDESNGISEKDVKDLENFFLGKTQPVKKTETTEKPAEAGHGDSSAGEVSDEGGLMGFIKGLWSRPSTPKSDRTAEAKPEAKPEVAEAKPEPAKREPAVVKSEPRLVVEEDGYKHYVVDIPQDVIAEVLLKFKEGTLGKFAGLGEVEAKDIKAQAATADGPFFVTVCQGEGVRKSCMPTGIQLDRNGQRIK